MSFVVVLSLWEYFGRAGDSLILPPFSAVALAFADFVVTGTFFESLAVSLVTFAMGMFVSISVGIAIGAGMALWRPVEQALDVYVNAAMGAPMIAFIPVFILLFGIGYPTRVLTVVIFAIFPIIINTFAGIRTVDPAIVEMGRSFGATRTQLFWQVRVPAAFALIGAGLRLGTVRGIKGLVNGEVIVAVVGLGLLVNRYGSAFTMDRLYAIVIFLVILTLLATGFVSMLTGKLVRH